MRDNQIGQFIRDMRLGRGMTQQQLASRLGVTDKAVSKWERGVSCPDITLLRELSDALGVSVAELLAGQREGAPQVPREVEEVVLDTVSYAEETRRRNGGWRFWLFVALTAGCIIAALVCCICNGFRFTWSRPAIQSIAFGWAVCCPLLRAERHPVRGSLAILSLAILPFLYQLHPALRKGWVAVITLLSTAYLWAVYAICLRLLRRRKWLAAGWAFLLGVPLSFAIHVVLQYACHVPDSDVVGITATGMAAAACFLVDFSLHRKGAA